MKLIYLHQYFTFPDSNGGTRSFDLASKFIENGIDVEIITSSAFIKNINLNEGWNLIEKDGLKLNILKQDYDNSMSYFKRIVIFISFLVRATIKLLQINSDVVLATSTPLTIGIPVIVKKIFHKTPFIFEVRDVWPEAVVAIDAIKNPIIIKLLEYLEFIIYKNSEFIVPLSSDMKKSIVNRYPKFEIKIPYVIPNISEINRFKVYPESNYLKNKIGFKPKKSILYAGTFGKVNGLNYVIDIASRIQNIDPDIKFILVGNGAEKNEIIKKANNLNLLNENIFILDSVSKNELPKLYNEVTVGSSFVIPIEELWSNSANKFFDSLAASKPVLINHEGWQAEEILRNKIGFVLNENASDENISEFVQWINNEELIKENSKNAFQLAKSKYSLEKAVEKYLMIIERIKA